MRWNRTAWMWCVVFDLGKNCISLVHELFMMMLTVMMRYDAFCLETLVIPPSYHIWMDVRGLWVVIVKKMLLNLHFWAKKLEKTISRCFHFWSINYLCLWPLFSIFDYIWYNRRWGRHTWNIRFKKNIDVLNALLSFFSNKYLSREEIVIITQSNNHIQIFCVDLIPYDTIRYDMLRFVFLFDCLLVSITRLMWRLMFSFIDSSKGNCRLEGRINPKLYYHYSHENDIPLFSDVNKEIVMYWYMYRYGLLDLKVSKLI